MSDLYSISAFLQYINIRTVSSDDVFVVRYDDYDSILLKSKPVAIDFYLLAIKQGFDIQEKDMSDAFLYLDKPDNLLEWDMSAPVSGYGIFISRKLLDKFAKDYTFMNYNNHEALFLTHDEKQILLDLFQKAYTEFQKQPISKDILVSYAVLISSYAQNFYQRQFESRSKVYNKIVADFYQELDAFFKKEDRISAPPSIRFFADKANLSTNYFADIIKHFTGQSPIDHIHQYIIQIAKNKLRQTNLSINEIAYSLGFEYPTYFTRFFKRKTGLTPKNFRNQ